MTGGTGTETVYSAGRIMSGPIFVPTRGMRAGTWDRTFNDLSRTSLSIGLQKYSDSKDLFESHDLNFNTIGATDKDNIVTMFEAVKTVKNIIFTIDPTDQTSIDATTYYGKFATAPSFQNILKTSSTELWNTRLRLDESL